MDAKDGTTVVRLTDEVDVPVMEEVNRVTFRNVWDVCGREV